MLVEDETGRPWAVEAGDPARKFVNELSAKGLTWVVLPCYTFMAGVLPGTEPPSAGGLRTLRLRDCVTYLKGLQ